MNNIRSVLTEKQDANITSTDFLLIDWLLDWLNGQLLCRLIIHCLLDGWIENYLAFSGQFFLCRLIFLTRYTENNRINFFRSKMLTNKVLKHCDLTKWKIRIAIQVRATCHRPLYWLGLIWLSVQNLSFESERVGDREIWGIYPIGRFI